MTGITPPKWVQREREEDNVTAKRMVVSDFLDWCQDNHNTFLYKDTGDPELSHVEDLDLINQFFGERNG